MDRSIRHILTGAAALAGTFSAGSAAAAYAVMKQAAGGRRQSYAEALAWQREHGDLSWFREEDLLRYTVTCGDGYVLHAAHLPCGDSDRFVILTHGHTDNLYGSLKYAKIYLDLGFHVIVYDLRGHGENAPHFCSFSVLESGDLAAVVGDAKERFHPAVVGLHGESLGAATTAAALERLGSQVQFAVCDCGFADFEMLMRYIATYRHLPEYTVNLASSMMKRRYGISFGEMHPAEHLRDNHIPTLFLHGGDDVFILPVHSSIMHRTTAGYSEFHIIPGAKHAASVFADRERYARYISTFMKSVLQETTQSP